MRSLNSKRLAGLRYRSSNPVKDGKWRKLSVGVEPPQGSPKLNVRVKSGYYAPKAD